MTVRTMLKAICRHDDIIVGSPSLSPVFFSLFPSSLRLCMMVVSVVGYTCKNLEDNAILSEVFFW